MEPMFLPDVESSVSTGAYGMLIQAMRAQGTPFPQIWCLFAYKPEATKHLERFTQAVMRGPSPLSSGLRELIAAFTSRHNHCPF